MFAVGLSYIAFIMLRYVPSITAFWRVFIINDKFVNVVYYIDSFVDIEVSLHPWDKAHMVMMYYGHDDFNMLLDSAC